MNKIEFIKEYLGEETNDHDLIRLFFKNHPNIDSILLLIKDIYCTFRYMKNRFIHVKLYSEDNYSLIKYQDITNIYVSLNNSKSVDKLYQIILYKHRKKVISEL